MFGKKKDEVTEVHDPSHGMAPPRQRRLGNVGT